MEIDHLARREAAHQIVWSQSSAACLALANSLESTDPLLAAEIRKALDRRAAHAQRNGDVRANRY